MQLTLTFSSPSSYHLIETSECSKDVFFTFVKGVIQSKRLPCSAQKALGSLKDAAYIVSYVILLAWDFAVNSAVGA